MASGLEALTVAGLAAATGGRALAGADAPLAGVSIDSRTLHPGELFVAIRGPRFDGHDFVAAALEAGAAAVLVEREVEVPPNVGLVRVPDTTRALADLGRERRQASAIPLVAITGSTGKTTSKEMAAAMLASRGPVLRSAGNLNNRYGLPLTLCRLAPEHASAVVELGMSAPGELRELTRIARPDVAVITNVAAVHIENFDSLRGIAEAKAEILEGLAPGGAAVLNRDDPELRRVGGRHRGEVIWFGRDRRCDVSAERWRGTIFGMRFDLRLAGRAVEVALPLAGPHAVANFLAAAAAAHRLGVAPGAIAEAALGMRAAEHRGEVLRLGGGVTLLDDSYNSNPLAVEAAVAALDLAPRGRRVAFLGDMLELGPRADQLHRRTGAAVAERLDVIAAVGAHAAALLDGARGAAPGVERHAFTDSAAAAAAAPGLVAPGDAVLVKGSRGLRMEAVVNALVAGLGAVRE